MIIAPLSIMLPKAMPFDPEAMRPGAMPGDICNRYGDIRGADTETEHGIVKKGVVMVAREQAVAAAPFGWELWDERPEDQGLVLVARK